MGAGPLIVSFIAIVIIAAGSAVAFVLYRNMLREAKNYERGLKDGATAYTFASDK